MSQQLNCTIFQVRPEVSDRHRARLRKTYRFPDVVVHQSTDLTDDQVVEVEALPVTSPIRTGSIWLPIRAPIQVGRIIDHIVLKRQGSLDEVCDLVLRLARHGKPGMKCMHRVLQARAGGSFLGESHLEAWPCGSSESGTSPSRWPQMALPWRSPVNGRVDFAYPEIRLIIELDGRALALNLGGIRVGSDARQPCPACRMARSADHLPDAQGKSADGAGHHSAGTVIRSLKPSKAANLNVIGRGIHGL